jgi:hypothetical protein
MKAQLKIRIDKSKIRVRCQFHKPTRAFNDGNYKRKEKFQKPLDNQ